MAKKWLALGLAVLSAGMVCAQTVAVPSNTPEEACADFKAKSEADFKDCLRYEAEARERNARFMRQFGPKDARATADPASNSAAEQQPDMAAFPEDLPEMFRQNQLPKGFKPDDVLVLSGKLAKLPRKDEFETTTQFEARHAAWRSKPFHRALTPGSVMAFNLLVGMANSSFTMVYDADRQIMDATLKLESDAAAPGGSQWVNYMVLTKRTGVRAAKTRMGVSFTVTSYDRSAAGLALVDVDTDVEMSMPVQLAEAAKLKQYAQMLIVGKLEDPYKVSKTDFISASLDSPQEITNLVFGMVMKPLAFIVYDTRSGKVLARRVAPHFR